MMEYAKKMVLIDSRAIQQQQLQHQVPSKSIPDARAETISALDKERRDILDRQDINEYDKAIKYMYCDAVMRYVHLIHNYQNRPIGRIEFKDETTTALREDKGVIKTEVIETLPKPLKKKGELLLKNLLEVSDLDWNRRGEIKFRGDWIHA